jgi:hypothetical protein
MPVTVQTGDLEMEAAWTTARNAYLGGVAMTTAAMAVAGLVAPAASGVAAVLLYFSAQMAGAKFADVAMRQMNRAETLRFLLIAVGIQLALGVLVLAVGLFALRHVIATIHFDKILLVGLLVVIITAALTLAGLRFGAAITLRRKQRLGQNTK